MGCVEVHFKGGEGENKETCKTKWLLIISKVSEVNQWDRNLNTMYCLFAFSKGEKICWIIKDQLLWLATSYHGKKEFKGVWIKVTYKRHKMSEWISVLAEDTVSPDRHPNIERGIVCQKKCHTYRCIFSLIPFKQIIWAVMEARASDYASGVCVCVRVCVCVCVCVKVCSGGGSEGGRQTWLG